MSVSSEYAAGSCASRENSASSSRSPPFRFLLQLCCSSSSLDHGPASLNVVETNPFKHLTHLCLKLLHGTDVEIKKFLASCLASMKVRSHTCELTHLCPFWAGCVGQLHWLRGVLVRCALHLG